MLCADGHCNYRFHRSGEGGDHTADGAPAPPNAVNDRVATQSSGNPGALRRRPAARISGNDAPVPRERREPDRLPRPADRANADSHRPVPGADSNLVQQPGRPGESFGQAVLVDHLCADTRRCAGEQRVPVDGPEPAGSVSHRDAGSGGGHHVGAAENDADAVAGPASTVQPNDDVVDDADLPGRVFAGLAQRLAPVLGCLQPHRNWHPVLHYRLGASIPTVPEARRRRVGTCAVGCRPRSSGE